jgi:hypothetical protein
MKGVDHAVADLMAYAPGLRPMGAAHSPRAAGSRKPSAPKTSPAASASATRGIGGRTLLQGMDDEGAGRVAASLHRLATRPNCSPAERHIFKVIAHAIDDAPAPVARRRFEVIQGGAA